MQMFGFLFDTESTFGRTMAKIGNLVISNLLFIAGCLTVITIGASICGLYRVMLKELRDGDVQVWKEYWYGFKSNFKQATICWIGTLVFAALAWVDIAWCRYAGGFFSYFEISVWVVCSICAVLLMFLFPSICAFENTLPNLIRNNMIFMLKKPLVSAGVLLCNVLPAALTFLDQVNQPTYVFLWFFAGFGLLAYACSWLLLKVFNDYLYSAAQ